MQVPKTQSSDMDLDGYSIGRKLGDGGMATVYMGEQLSLQRPVAIKVLKNNLVEDAEIRRLFERESLIIAKLNHPNIIHVIDQGITSSGQPFFIMDYIKGVSLDRVIKKGGLKLNPALNIFTQIAKALSYAHKNGVIHRDIKPANILVGAGGIVKVLDFGISDFYQDFGHGVPDDADMVKGTFSYLAPELRHSSHQASAQSDIYSLGVVMYQFFTGTLPEPAKVAKPSDFNKSLSADLDQLILECLASNPSHRPASADVLKNKLLLLMHGGHLNAEQHKRASVDFNKSFHLLDVIKEDRFASVYLFEERKSGSLIVIKKADCKSRGFDEAKVIASVDHQNVVNILGTSRNDRTFILVMDYYSGGTLAELLTHPFEAEEFYPIAIQMADGMAAAHNAGVVHGNLRPSNVLFSSNNQVKVSDFGFTQHYGKHSPEQNWYSIESEPETEKSDIYSVGVIYYQMLVGELPKLKFLKLVPCDAFQRLPEELQKLIKNMLILDPTKRISSFSQVSRYLQDLRDDMKTVVVQRKSKPVEMPVIEEPEEEEVEGLNWFSVFLFMVLLALLTVHVCLWLTGNTPEYIETIVTMVEDYLKTL